MDSTTRASEIGEAQLKLLTLEDCLNLALKLRISSKSPDGELSTSRLCLRLVWFLVNGGFPIQASRRLQLMRLGRDLQLFLLRYPRHRPDLDLYHFPE